MSTDERATADAFERRLLTSARQDAPPDSPEAAWSRFTATFHLTAPTPHPPPPPPPLPAPAAASAMKWLLLGAIGGTALTAGFMQGRRSPVTPVPASPAPLQRVAKESISPRPPVPLEEASKPSASKPRAPRPHHRLGSAPAHSPPAPDPSTLIAEVARIDAARAALARGDAEEALTRIAHYHRDFPRSALAPDADVVALEALAAQKDWPALQRQAAAFLTRYPHDPHTPHVQALARPRP